MLILLLLFALAGAGCTRTPEVSTRTRVARVPADFDARSIVISDDGKSHAYVSRGASGFRVVHDGREGPLFLEVSQPHIAPATHSVFYWGTEALNGRPKITLVAGDATIATALEKPGYVTFASGGRWAAVGGTAARADGTVSRGPVLLYRDGREVASYPDATVPALSRDGQHAALLVEKGNGEITLVVDEKDVRSFAMPQGAISPWVRPNVIGPNLPGLRVDFLSDGTLMFLTRDESGWSIYQNQQRVASYRVNVIAAHGLPSLDGGLQYATAVVSDLIGFARDVPVAAWWERLEGAQPRWRVVRNGKAVDGVICAKPWMHEAPLLSADGTRVAYACPRLSTQGIEQLYVVSEGRELGPYFGLWGLALSPVGQQVAYAVDDDAPGRPWRYFVDGVPRPTRYDRVWPPRYSRDGRLLYWVAARRNRIVFVVNGSGRASSESVVWVPTETTDGSLWWITQRGRLLSRIEVSRR